MKAIIKEWNEHLKENRMTYREHWMFAVGHGLTCIKAGIYLIVHGFFPCFYKHAGSNLVSKLEKEFNNKKNRE